MFDIQFVLLDEKLSIRQIAFKLLSLLEILSLEDEVFKKFKVLKLNYQSVEFDLSRNTYDTNVLKLSETILRFELGDIRNYEKEENPSIDYSRDLGFRVLFEFELDKKKHFSLFASLGALQRNSIAITYFPFENSNYPFEWYYKILNIGNEFLKPLTSSVRLVLDQYMAEYLPLNVMYPLGWISYFSKVANMKIASDFGFEIISEDSGDYLIVTREDFTRSKERYIEVKEKLIGGMVLLKALNPDYIKKNTVG